MFPNRLLITFMAVVALTMTASLLHAGVKVVPTPFPLHHTVIGAITEDSITVDTLNNSKTYKITKYTTITFEGRTVTTKELKPGMKVSITLGNDPDTVDFIRASPAPIEPSPTPDNVLH